jgi:hypothetical protein
MVIEGATERERTAGMLDERVPDRARGVGASEVQAGGVLAQICLNRGLFEL